MNDSPHSPARSGRRGSISALPLPSPTPMSPGVNVKAMRSLLEVDEETQALVSEESEKLRISYSWLLSNLPQPFLDEMNKELLTVVAHNLTHFNVNEEYSHIVFPTEAVVLCLDNPEADTLVLERYSKKAMIKNYWAQTSISPLPGYNQLLRVTHVEFASWARLETEKGISLSPLQQLRIEKNRKLAQSIKKGIDDANITEEDIFSVLCEMNDRFTSSVPLERLTIAIALLFNAQKTDVCQFALVRHADFLENGGPSVHIVLAWRNVSKLHFLHKLSRLVNRHNLAMKRVNCTYVRPYTDNSVFVLGLGLHGADGVTPAWEAANLTEFMRELSQLKYFRFFDMFSEKLVDPGLISGDHGNLLRSFVSLIHQTLLDVDPNMYTFEKTREALTRHPEISAKLCIAFNYKFNPAAKDLEKYERTVCEIKEQLQSLDTGFPVNDTRRRNVLSQALNIIDHTLKTNFFSAERMAVSFRLDPSYLDHTPFDRKKKYPELPFSVFYVKGLHFFGFHIRFRDLARGGLRTVTPTEREKAEAERENIFTEVYNLAYTQHKKNKDIPESGAKCIIFLAPDEELKDELGLIETDCEMFGLPQETTEKVAREYKQKMTLHYLHFSQRAFVSALLDILNSDENGKLKNGSIVDYYGKPEYIYLGPDENMHNPMIQWIANYSKSVGYKPGGSFISGRLDVGFNHKQYGVTSLGVFVYVKKVLRHLGIEPESQEFTVKITGGPDGDVAGNLIRNLEAHCPKTAKLLVVTDGTGTVYDPKGLDLTTLVGMFHKQQGIRFYPPEKLSEGGFLLDIQTTRQVSSYTLETLCWKKSASDSLPQKEWLTGSATNHLFRFNAHSTKTDIFIPCGGRPRTLNDSNWKDFLDEQGKPTSLAIVEGANLYLTPGARKNLEDLGCLVIKDSSANKCGVICSSYEVLCGLALTEQQFLEDKDLLIRDVLDILQQRADSEATLLLNTKAEKPNMRLTEISDLLSEKIIFYTDQFLEYFSNETFSSDPNDPLVRMYMEYAPKILQTKYTEALLHRVPVTHKRAIIASSLACHLVYKNGIDWSPSVVDLLPVLMKRMKHAQDLKTLTQDGLEL